MEIFQYNAVDLEGTAVDLEGLHQEALEQVASNYGVRFGQHEFHSFVGAGDKAISEAISKMTTDKIDPIIIRAEKEKLYEELLYSYPISPREGVSEYLETVRSLGGELVLASITPDGNAFEILRRSDLLRFFNPGHILTESSVKKLKPDPEVYIKASEIFGIQASPEKMLVHEDSPPGKIAAEKAGARVVVFPVHEGLVFDLQPDAIFTTWKDITPQLVYDKIMSSKP